MIFRGNQCLSLHQVKAYKAGLFSDYHTDINSQKENATDRGIQTVYFHVAREMLRTEFANRQITIPTREERQSAYFRYK